MELPRPSLRLLSQAVLALAIVAAAAGVVAILLRDSSPGAVEIVLPTSTPPSDVRVYVTGAVNEPGVHQVEEGARLAEAVEAAGGAAPDADLVAVNLAMRRRRRGPLAHPPHRRGWASFHNGPRLRRQPRWFGQGRRQLGVRGGAGDPPADRRGQGSGHRRPPGRQRPVRHDRGPDRSQGDRAPHPRHHPGPDRGPMSRP